MACQRCQRALHLPYSQSHGHEYAEHVLQPASLLLLKRSPQLGVPEMTPDAHRIEPSHAAVPPVQE